MRLLTYQRSCRLNTMNPDNCRKVLFFNDDDKRESLFSPWSRHTVEFEGITFYTLGHAVIYQKALGFGKDSDLANIVASKSKEEACKIASTFNPSKGTDWDECERKIMLTLMTRKIMLHNTAVEFIRKFEDCHMVYVENDFEHWGIGKDPVKFSYANIHVKHEDNIVGKALVDAYLNLCKRARSPGSGFPL